MSCLNVSTDIFSQIFRFLELEDQEVFLKVVPKHVLKTWFDMETRSCNKEQKEILWKICFENKYLLVTGEPGTGKTFLLKLAAKMLVKLSHIVQVCAFTGLACQNADGSTIHRLFPINQVCNNWNKDTASPNNSNHSLDKFIPFNGVLLIDEVSMISPILFEQIMYFQSNASNLHFRVIAFGDFLQLPPIIDSSLLSKEECYKRKFFFQNYYMNKFEIQQLTIPERHSDPAFLKIIRMIRLNDYSPEVLSFLKQRKIAFDFLNTKDRLNKLYLFHDNKRVNIHNEKILETLPSATIEIETQISSIISQTSCRLFGVNVILSSTTVRSYDFQNQAEAYTDCDLIKNAFHEKNVKNVSLKIGCNIMFTKNIYRLINCPTPEECGFFQNCKHINQFIDIFNGTCAKVLKFYPLKGILVELQNEPKTNLFFPYKEYSILLQSCTKESLKLCSYVVFTKGPSKGHIGKIIGKNVDKTLTISICGKNFNSKIANDFVKAVSITSIKPILRTKNLIVNVSYFPIVLCYALTIQKAQGMTLDNVVLSLRYIPSPFLVTVAISRCRTSNGVFINGDFNKPQGDIDTLIKDFYLKLSFAKRVKRPIEETVASIMETLNIKLVCTTRGQFTVSMISEACPFFCTSKKHAVQYVYDCCFKYIGNNFNYLLSSCSLQNIVSALAKNQKKIRIS